MKKTSIILFLIVCLAFFFRIWHVTSVPPSLYWDEVSQGYNAYSILKTGKDEHQEFFPLARFQAFGDYKAPVYIYLDVPFLALFGKTDLAVRLPSIVFGSLTVLLTYFLIQQLFPLHKKKEILGLTGAFFLAISPWHIQLSRAAFEANIATFFTVLGVTLFLYSVKKHSWMFTLSSISFVLAIYSFNAHRIFVPLFVIALAVVELRSLLLHKKQIVVAGVIGLILLIPFILFLKTPESRIRFQEVNIFSDVETVKKANIRQQQDNYSLSSKVFDNRRTLFSYEYLVNYFDFFNPTYLFSKGDANPRFSDQANGQLFLWMVPLLLIGGYQLLLHRGKVSLVLIGWVVLAPVAAATARETPHALRSETFIPTFEIIAALGAVTLFFFLAQYLKKYAYLTLVFFAGVVAFSLVYFWHNYLIHNPVQYSYDWQYGYKQLIQKLKPIEKKYDKIYFTNNYGRAYIYTAWYGDIEPEQFFKEVEMKKDVYGLYNVDKLGKYYFTDSYQKNEKGKILYITLPSKIPSQNKVLDTVAFLNGEKAFVISEKL